MRSNIRLFPLMGAGGFSPVMRSIRLPNVRVTVLVSHAISTNVAGSVLISIDMQVNISLQGGMLTGHGVPMLNRVGRPFI
jgi:hypothetical protein